MTGERKALEARVEKNILALNNLIGRGTRIRTADLQYPKLPRYQAALYPGTAMSIHAKGTSSKARGRQIGRPPSARCFFGFGSFSARRDLASPFPGGFRPPSFPWSPARTEPAHIGRGAVPSCQTRASG